MLERILVPSDLSFASNSVIPYAATLAQTFNSKLYLVHVMDPSELRKPEKLTDFPRLGKFFESDRESEDLPPLATTVPVGKFYRYDEDPDEVILKFAEKRKVDLICMAATHNSRKLAWWSAGEMVESIIKKARCPVFCMRGRAIKPNDWKRPRFKNILLLLDVHDEGAAPLLKTLPWVHTFNSMLHIFPIMRNGRTPRQNPLREVAQLDSAQTNVLLFAGSGSHMKNLSRFVANTPIDLIVMPSPIRSRLSLPFVNNVLVRLMKLSDAPILMMR